MNHKITLLVALFISQLTFSQVVINELDCDSPGAENMEFLELLSETPNYPLDGFVVVFLMALILEGIPVILQ